MSPSTTFTVNEFFLNWELSPLWSLPVRVRVSSAVCVVASSAVHNMEDDPYVVLLHTGNLAIGKSLCWNTVERLNESFQILLRSHEALKAQNDDILVRIGLEQHFALEPIIKGKQMEEDRHRAGPDAGVERGSDGDAREPVGLVGSSRRWRL